MQGNNCYMANIQFFILIQARDLLFFSSGENFTSKGNTEKIVYDEASREPRFYFRLND